MFWMSKILQDCKYLQIKIVCMTYKHHTKAVKVFRGICNEAFDAISRTFFLFFHYHHHHCYLQRYIILSTHYRVLFSSIPSYELFSLLDFLLVLGTKYRNQVHHLPPWTFYTTCTSLFTLLVPHLLYYLYFTFYTTCTSPFILLIPHLLHYSYLIFNNSKRLAKSRALYIPNSLLESFSQCVLMHLAAPATTSLPHKAYSSFKHTKIIQRSHCIVFFLILKVQVSSCSHQLGTRI